MTMLVPVIYVDAVQLRTVWRVDDLRYDGPRFNVREKGAEFMSATLFSLLLESNVKARLEEEARIADRPAAVLASKAIEAFLDARAAKREELESAIIESDKGVFISSEAIDRWMASWDTPDELPPPRPDVFD